MSDHRHHVVIVGAGFGGLEAAKALAELPVDVSVVDARNHHTFQPLLYQVATAGLDGDDICSAVRGLLAGQANARVLLGEVTAVDLDRRRLTLGDGTPLHYDELVLAAGAVTNTFGVPGVAEHAFGLKSLGDALALRSHVLACFEQADADPRRLEDGTLTTVIAGGGPTGVELAGGLLELGSRVLRRDFPGLDLRPARVVLVEAGDRLLPGMHPDAVGQGPPDPGAAGGGGPPATGGGGGARRRGAARRRAARSRPRRWCGPRAWWPIPWPERLGVELTHAGRVVVGPDLTVPGHPEVYVVGDMAAIDGLRGPRAPPGGAGGGAGCPVRGAFDPQPPARRARPCASSTVDRGSMATIGRHDAVAELPWRTPASRGPSGGSPGCCCTS